MTKIQARRVKKLVYTVKIPSNIIPLLQWKEEDKLFAYKSKKNPDLILVNKLDTDLSQKIDSVETLRKIIQNKTKNNALFLTYSILFLRQKVLEYLDLAVGDKVIVSREDRDTLSIKKVGSSDNIDYTTIDKKEDYFVSYSIVIPNEIIAMMSWSGNYYLHWEKDSSITAIVTAIKLSDENKPIKKGYDTEIQPKKRRFEGDELKEEEQSNIVKTIGFAATIPKYLITDMNWKKGDRLIWIPIENSTNTIKIRKVPDNE